MEFMDRLEKKTIHFMAFETLARILQHGHFDQTDVEPHFFPLLRTDFSRSFITQVLHRLPQMCLPHLSAADPAAWEQILLFHFECER